jgi:hypothetical protein
MHGFREYAIDCAFGMQLAMSHGIRTKRSSTGDRKRPEIGGNTVYVLFAAPVLSLAAIFAVTLRNQFASKTDL